MKRHLLIVDDEPSIRDLLKAYFTRQGFEVSLAATAEEGRQMAAALPIDLIIMDMLLPDSEGLELLARLKEDQPNRPIIVMTGIGQDEELLQESIQMGASGYASKTLPLDQVLLEVRRALNSTPLG